VPGAFKYQWSVLFSGEGIADGAQDIQALANDPSSFPQYVQNNCANFPTQVCVALTEVAAQGYPSQASIDFLRHASVAAYMKDIKVPTYLAQGEADSLFDLQESVATYHRLQAQGTPVAMAWQSWGHSHLTPVAGELDERHPANSYEGRQLIAWFDHYVKGTGPQPPLDFRYFRPWVYAATNDIDQAYAVAPSFPVGSGKTFFLSGSDVGGSTLRGVSTGRGALVTNEKQVTPGTSAWSSSSPFGPNYTETSALESSLKPEPPVTDPPGSSVRFLTAPLTAPMTVVGSPRLTVQLDAPAVATTQAAGPGGQLVLFAKVYDVGPGGTVELPNRLISPVRVADVTKPVTIELPGIVHRFAAGHRLAIVLAGGDLAYRGSTAPQQVTLATGGAFVQKLLVPTV